MKKMEERGERNVGRGIKGSEMRSDDERKIVQRRKYAMEKKYE